MWALLALNRLRVLYCDMLCIEFSVCDTAAYVPTVLRLCPKLEVLDGQRTALLLVWLPPSSLLDHPLIPISRLQLEAEYVMLQSAASETPELPPSLPWLPPAAGPSKPSDSGVIRKVAREVQGGRCCARWMGLPSTLCTCC
jgi:hypothetical protein